MRINVCTSLKLLWAAAAKSIGQRRGGASGAQRTAGAGRCLCDMSFQCVGGTLFNGRSIGAYANRAELCVAWNRPPFSSTSIIQLIFTFNDTFAFASSADSIPPRPPPLPPPAHSPHPPRLQNTLPQSIRVSLQTVETLQKTSWPVQNGFCSNLIFLPFM